jgi:hypothetical protein
MQKKTILKNDIEIISVKDFLTDYLDVEETYFYIGDELTNSLEDEMIKLYKFPLSLVKDYNLSYDCSNDEPNEYIPYIDILIKEGKVFNIFKCFYTENFFYSFSDSLKKLFVKWSEKYKKDFYLEQKDTFGYNLIDQYTLNPLNKIIYNRFFKISEEEKEKIKEIYYRPAKYNEPYKPLFWTKGEPKITKLHLSIKPEYVLYVFHMIFKNTIKLNITRQLDSDKEEDIRKIRPDIPNNLFITYYSLIEYFKFVPNFGISHLSSYFNLLHGKLPTFTFYVDFIQTKELISGLKSIFSDEIIEKINFNKAPRYNLRINKMIYVAFGNGDDKKIPYLLTHLFDQPDEYKELEKLCITKLNEPECLKINEYSQKYSDNDICVFDKEENKCKESDNKDRLGLVYNWGDYTKLEKIYNKFDVEKPANIEDYKQKYLKYKMKYLALKQKN